MLIPDITSHCQSAFVKDKQILDSVLVANECIDSRLRSGKAGFVCKIDIEKAYDRVNWGCLDYTQDRFGFGPKWRRWVQGCLKTTHFSVLINGKSTEKFKSSRGIRQGDPLSPSCFC